MIQTPHDPKTSTRRPPSASIRVSSRSEPSKPIHQTESEGIIGCAFEVLNHLGHGLLEKPYENALVVEFALRHIPCEQQRRYDFLYKTVKVGEYIPDLIAFGSIVVDVKAQVEPLVQRLFAELGDAHKVVERVKADPSLRTRARQVALQVTLRTSLARLHTAQP